MKKHYLFLALLFISILAFGKTREKSNTFIDHAVKDLQINQPKADSYSYHLFSHGQPGKLFIDNRWLDAVAIADRFAKDVEGKKELYIYGCNFAAGEEGKIAIAYLEKVLKVSVSASINITGVDGDWKLEIGNGRNSLKLPYYKGNLQLDNTHYLNPIVFSQYDHSTIVEEYIYLSTPKASNITVQMNFPSGIGSPRVSVTNLTTNTVSYVSNGVITFNNANPVRLQFVTATNSVIHPGNTPTTIPYAQAGITLSGTSSGLIFDSADQFYVNYRGRSTPQAGSVMTKGKQALGKEFRWGGSPIEMKTNIAAVGNMLSVMATADNTTVIISNIAPGTKFQNGTNATLLTGPSITRILNKGESFILYAPVQTNTFSPQDAGWLGAKVASDKDISIIEGGLLQQGSAANGRDIGLDQIVPITHLGLEHVIMQGNGGANEKVIVIATANNTKIFVNGSSSPITTLAAGGYYLLPASNFNTGGNMLVRVTQPAYVFHKIFGSTQNNTNSIMFIPPLNCFGQKEVDLIPDVRKIGNFSYTGTKFVVLAASGTANTPNVTLNGTPLTAAATTITGNTNWVSYRYNINSDGNIKVNSNSAIQAQIFGANDNAGFGGYYSGFGVPATATLTLDTPYSTPCIGTTTMTANSTVPGTYQWYKNNVAIPGATTSTYTLTGAENSTSATYHFVVTYPGGCTLQSNDYISDFCPCPKPGATGTPANYTDFGISTRNSRTTTNWPHDIANGFIALESNTKGFVITRIESPETAIANPTAGMLVYDTVMDCLKLYNGDAWNCIKQTCND